MPFWSQNLTNKVASSFLFLSLATVGVVGGVAFGNAREALKQAAFNRLSVAATLKEEEINRWFEDQEQDFFLTTRFPVPDIQRNLNLLLTSPPNSAAYRTAYSALSSYLTNIKKLKPNFQEIFILDRSNRILLSTNKRHEGNYEILASVTYLEEIQPGDTFSPIFYVSPLTGKPAVTLATPLRDRTGKRQGAFLAHLNLDRIDQIVRERTGLGESGETYLVGSLVSENAFISREEPQIQEFSQGVSSAGIDSAMQGMSGYGLYRNYAGVPVLGVYRWLNDQDIALLVEMTQDEAFAPARQLAGTIMLVGLAAMGMLAIGVYWLTRQLQISRQQLENYSHQLEQKANEASAANRAKSEFLANMSHELRTPLNAILGFTQLMAREVSVNSSQLEHLQIISRSGEHLMGLINDILEMSKIEAGQTTLNESSFDFYRLLDSLEEMLVLKARSKSLQLRFERSPNVPQYVCTDEGKLRQVLINLLDNAIKFTQTGTVMLRVDAKRPELLPSSYASSEAIYLAPPPSPASSEVTRLDFAVSDTGSGIAPGELKLLFEPFVQAETGRKSQQGTGLGLPISQKFVRLMGGDLTVNSVLGQGTTFTFEIEIRTVAASDVPLSYPNRRVIGLEPDQPSYRILVVEDKWENRQLLVTMLTTVGFDVRQAENGQAGVALWEIWEPHLIWMDMRMPVMDGYEATKRIRSHLKGQATVIIALTASAFEEARSSILAAGCDDFVPKPFQERVIFDKIAEHLGVRYHYASDGPQDPIQGWGAGQKSLTPHPLTPSPPHPLVPTDLTIMPIAWRHQLHQAAMRVNAKHILDLVEQIPPSHPHLAEALTQRLNSFSFEEILRLSQDSLDLL